MAEADLLLEPFESGAQIVQLDDVFAHAVQLFHEALHRRRQRLKASLGVRAENARVFPESGKTRPTVGPLGT